MNNIVHLLSYLEFSRPCEPDFFSVHRMSIGIIIGIFQCYTVILVDGIGHNCIKFSTIIRITKMGCEFMINNRRFQALGTTAKFISAGDIKIIAFYVGAAVAVGFLFRVGWELAGWLLV